MYNINCPVHINYRYLFRVIYMKKYALTLSAFLVLLTAVFIISQRNTPQDKPSSAGTIRTQRTIILDPGHGGFDGGATASDGTPEKDFNLQIALKLKDYLSLAGFHVVMTRTQDVGTEAPGAETIREKKVSDIRSRMALVNDTPDCLLLSIHQNYFEDASCRGTQVFYSKNHPQSKIIAEYIQSGITLELQPDNTRLVKAAGKEIYLLKNAQRPAVLVECGFISNSRETQQLHNETYQQQLSFCIAKALFDYINTPEDG